MLLALLRGELDWVVMKCLEKQRDRRYETANGLARDIQRYLADELVEARPPSASYRFRKFVLGHKGQVLAASLVLFALLTGSAGTTWGILRSAQGAEGERPAKMEAEEQKTAALNAAEQERQATGARNSTTASVSRSWWRIRIDLRVVPRLQPRGPIPVPARPCRRRTGVEATELTTGPIAQCFTQVGFVSLLTRGHHPDATCFALLGRGMT
jgi:hypothetical protein